MIVKLDVAIATSGCAQHLAQRRIRPSAARDYFFGVGAWRGRRCGRAFFDSKRPMRLDLFARGFRAENTLHDFSRSFCVT